MTVKTKPRTAPGNQRRVVVTAGATVEFLDPVRYITNRSTGMMGYEIARECLKKKFSVCLVTGPVCIKPPLGAEVVKVFSAKEMSKEVTVRSASCDCLIMAAAICDFRPEKPAKQKIKKKEKLTINFVKNPDILGSLRKEKGFVKIGFALETENALNNGKKKLKNKDLDLIVVNTIGSGENPFGKSVTDYTFLGKDGNARALKKLNKPAIAKAIVFEAARLMGRGCREK